MKILFIVFAFLLVGCQTSKHDVAVGYSPNLTHAQALIGFLQGDFQEELGPNVKLKTHVFHAGPSIIEALFAEEIDIAFVGPIPAINSFAKSKEKFVVLAGGANGGAALVARKGSGIESIDDLEGKKLATPQLGNTQDVTARAYLKERKLYINGRKDPVLVYPVSNPDQINLFRKEDVDLAWTVEPWVTRLVRETGATILMREAEAWAQWGYTRYATTLVLARKSFVKSNPGIVRQFLNTHVRLTHWMNENPEEAQAVANHALALHLGKPLGQQTLVQAWRNIDFTWVPVKKGLDRNAKNAFQIGFLRKEVINLSNLFHLEPLRSALQDQDFSTDGI